MLKQNLENFEGMVDFCVKRETFQLKVGFVSTPSEIGDTSQTAIAPTDTESFRTQFFKAQISSKLLRNTFYTFKYKSFSATAY